MSNPQMTPYEWARWYHDRGISIIPAKNKRPTVDWKQYQDERADLDQLAAWFKGETFSRGLQLFAIAGRVSNVVILDCDSAEAEVFWRDLLGADLMDSTAALVSGSGKGFHHYWFTLGEQEQESRAAHKDEMHWDLQSNGGGAVLPPSMHKAGNEYEWVRDLTHIQPWPYPEIPGKGVNSVEGGGDRQGLAHLLTNPGEGGRNNWVTAVMGHFAKKLDFEDGYRAQAELIWHVASELPGDDSYTRAEFDKTVTSVWDTEKRKIDAHPAEIPDANSGWLVSHGNLIYALCLDKEKNESLLPVSDFGIRAKEKVYGTDEEVSYVVDVIKRDGEIKEFVIPGDILGSNDKFARWCSSHDMVFHSNAWGDQGARISRVQRMQMLLVSHDPRVIDSVPHMGHHRHPHLGDIYVTREGVITKNGPKDFSVRPDASKHEYHKNWEYGFHGSREEAQAVLREVMTFHDSLTTSLFGSVWALAPIKDTVMHTTSLFPMMAIIAPSESGKTNGFFDLMLQLNGRVRASGTFTAAALRDEIAVHRSGFVWIDDPSNTDDLGELLRGAAGEGEHAKKSGANWSKTSNTKLVAPIVLSAEGMEMLKERAMLDRTIQIEATSPTQRRSRYSEDRPQWDDIQALLRTGSLNRYAGWYVQMALEWLDQIGGVQGFGDLVNRLRVGDGRQAEKMGLVRAGSELLHSMMGSYTDSYPVPGYRSAGGGDSIPVHDIVSAWSEGDTREHARGAYITSVVIPTYLASLGYIPTSQSLPAACVWITNTHSLRVNTAQLADWWMGHSSKLTNRARAAQLGSPTAMASEANAGNWPSVPRAGVRYRVIPQDIVWQILDEVGMHPVTDGELVEDEM